MNIFKSGVRLSGSIIVAAVLGFFLCISMNVIFTGLFTKDIGYNAFVFAEAVTSILPNIHIITTIPTATARMTEPIQKKQSMSNRATVYRLTKFVQP